MRGGWCVESGSSQGLNVCEQKKKWMKYFWHLSSQFTTSLLTLLSWRWLRICLPIGSDECIPWFDLFASTACKHSFHLLNYLHLHTQVLSLLLFDSFPHPTGVSEHLCRALLPNGLKHWQILKFTYLCQTCLVIFTFWDSWTLFPILPLNTFPTQSSSAVTAKPSSATEPNPDVFFASINCTYIDFQVFERLWYVNLLTHVSGNNFCTTKRLQILKYKAIFS